MTSIPVNIAVIILLGFNLIGCFLSTYPSEKFGQKTTLIIGLSLMLFCHISIIVFKSIGVDSAIIAFLVLYLLSFQGSLGPVGFLHTQETCHASVVGVSSMTMMLFTFLTSLVTPILV